MLTQLFSYFGFFLRSHFDSPITNFFETLGKRTNVSLWPPLVHKYENKTLGQNIWDKSLMILGASWGRH